MKVAINATALSSPLTGIGQYTYQLASELIKSNKLEIDYFYGLYWGSNVRQHPVENIQTIKGSMKSFVPNVYDVARVIKQYIFLRGIKKYSSDIYHEPNFLAFKTDKPTVITVHDLSWIRYPEAHPADRVRAMHKYFEPGLRRAALVLTDSEFVRQELIDVFSYPQEKIRPVLLGADRLFRPLSVTDVSAVLAKYDLQYGRYILAVGTLEPRKNLQLALRAYMQLPAALRKVYPMVLVGMTGWNTSALEQQLAPLIRAGDIRQLGYLPREELAAITAAACTMVYPSLYEGFGLPPLESMACGVPVIASNVSSIPEVVGDSGILIGPHDEKGLSVAIQSLIEDSARRCLLSDAALMRSAQFSWKKCAEETLSAYEAVLQKT